MQYRWQISIVLACILVCLFAFQAKLSQYEAVHSPITDVSSNKIWSSIDKRSSAPGQLTAVTFFELAVTLSVFLLAIVGWSPVQVGRSVSFEPFTRVSPIRWYGPQLFRRPPPAV